MCFNKTRLFLLIILVFLCSCHKDNSNVQQLPPPVKVLPVLPVADGLPVNVTLDEIHTGAAIPQNFEGLSYETGILAESPDILNVNNKVLVQLIKNLGPGILRIGGDSIDEVFWTGNARNASTGKDSLTTTDVDRLAAFSQAIGWPVFFGLNLGNSTPAIAANEAQYVYNSLRDNLYAIQAGNEPDVYHLFGLRGSNYSINDYLGEFETYKSAVQLAAPHVNFAGPGIAYNTDFISAFAESENKNVTSLDAHYYVAGPASSPSITYKTILSPNWKLDNLLSIIKPASSKFSLPYRITETNNVYGGGKAGVSDTFASALWALDFMWTIAQNGGKGVNFHGGNGLIYSPVTIENGVITVRPEYYAMLAFKNGSAGEIIPAVSDQPDYNCSAYACLIADGTRAVTLINKDDTQNFSFTVHSVKNISSILVSRLAAPAITSTTGTTFAGNMAKTDGTFIPSPVQYNTNNQKSFVVNVHSGSAVVVILK